MSEPAPEPCAVRYFIEPAGGLQAVHNCPDPGPYLAAGFDEVDEATYRAAMNTMDGT